MRTLVHRGIESQVYFWRTAAGSEVDLVVEVAGELIPVEVKLSATPRAGMAKSLITFMADFEARAGRGFVVHPGDLRLPLGSQVLAWPFGDF